MTPGSLTRVAERVSRALSAGGFPHAFGGAIALGYHAEPRATIDIDIDVFVPTSAARAVLECLCEHRFALDLEVALAAVAQTDQVRLWLDGVLVDLFFANFPFHESCARRAVTVPFGDLQVQVLSAEDIVIWKVLFDRPKDWLDIRQVLLTQGRAFDAPYALRWLTELLGNDDTAVERLRQELADALKDLSG